MSGDRGRAALLWRDAIVVDMHNDLPSRVADEGYDAAVRHAPGDGHTDVPRLLESGITAQWMAAWVDATYRAGSERSPFARAVRLIGIIDALVARDPARLARAASAAEIVRAKAEGRVAILVGVEGGHAIEGSLERLGELHALGMRYLTLTWNNGNEWAGSSLGEGGTRTGGLTSLGRAVIREMERLGVLVDLSHVSDATFDDVLDVASRPVIASHSNARALYDHPRNLTDRQLRAIAAGGGVACANFYPLFLDPEFAAGRRSRMPLSVLVDHLDHMASVAGIAHVGLGSDFDGISAVPEGLEDISCMPRIAEALLDRGFGEDDVRAVIGGNVLRVMAEL